MNSLRAGYQFEQRDNRNNCYQLQEVFFLSFFYEICWLSMGQWPVYIILFFIAFLDHKEYSMCSASVSKNERNVGSVLFDRSTSCNHCWTKEELVILSSRKAFQNFLPEVETSKMQDDQYVGNLLNFFNACLEFVCNMSVGKTKHLIMKSFADTMGGYLHSYVGPITKVAFYAGNIKYSNIKRIYELINELKDFLNTNGAGWSKPMVVEMFINVTPIVVPDKNVGACDKLIVNSESESKSDRNRSKRRRRRLKRKFATHESVEEDNNGDSRQVKSPFVFLPYFDNDFEPYSIALPFKDHNLWSLFDEDSVDVLSKYYATCVQCIKSRDAYEKILADFNRDFYKWLLQSVYPHLSDDRWYPAFGGVLKIIAILKDEDVKKEVPNFHKQELLKTDENESPFGTWQLILIAISTAALVWLLVGLILICYKYHQTHSGECCPCESTDLNSHGNVCDPNNRQSASDRVKEWWKRKFRDSEKCDQIKKQYSAVSVCKSKESIRTHAGRRVYKKRKKSRRSISISGSPRSSSPRYAYFENKQFFYSSDMSSSNSEDSSYR